MCAIHRPGQVAVTAAVILRAAKLAADRADDLHTILRNSLIQLESDVIAERTIRLEKLRIQREKAFDSKTENNLNDDEMDVSNNSGSISTSGYIDSGAGGISRDDPMLAWASLHQAAGLREIV